MTREKAVRREEGRGPGAGGRGPACGARPARRRGRDSHSVAGAPKRSRGAGGRGVRGAARGKRPPAADCGGYAPAAPAPRRARACAAPGDLGLWRGRGASGGSRARRPVHNRPDLRAEAAFRRSGGDAGTWLGGALDARGAMAAGAYWHRRHVLGCGARGMRLGDRHVLALEMSALARRHGDDEWRGERWRWERPEGPCWWMTARGLGARLGGARDARDAGGARGSPGRALGTGLPSSRGRAEAARGA